MHFGGMCGDTGAVKGDNVGDHNSRTHTLMAHMTSLMLISPADQGDCTLLNHHEKCGLRRLKF